MAAGLEKIEILEKKTTKETENILLEINGFKEKQTESEASLRLMNSQTERSLKTLDLYVESRFNESASFINSSYQAVSVCQLSVYYVCVCVCVCECVCPLSVYCVCVCVCV